MNKEPIIITDKIVIGISACCMGSPVRYNGKGWNLLQNIGREKNDFVWLPVCPECMSGMGVLRSPIHIQGEDGASVWKGEGRVRSRKGQDVTEDIKMGAMACLDALNRGNVVAYVYMDGSPSCGVYRTTLKNQRRGKPPGVFGSLLKDNGFFLIPANDLQSPLKWWDWRRRLLAFYWIKTVPMTTKKEVYEVWHHIKFICQELEEKWAREVGRQLAKLEDKDIEHFSERLRSEILMVLRQPSQPNKIVNRLWKHYAHYRKKSGKAIEDINSPDFKRNMTTIAKELILLERTSVEEGVLMGTTPVIYRTHKPDYVEEED